MVNDEDAPGGGRNAGSSAWAGLANTHHRVDPKRDSAAGVLVAQILPFAGAKVLDLPGAFERAAYAAG